MNDFDLKRVDDLLVEYGIDVVKEMQLYLADTNNLKASIKSTVNDGTLDVTFAYHGLYVNDGRKPGSKMPPAKPIADWMKSKGIDEKALFPIRRKIGRDGIQARPFFHYFTDNINQLYKDIATAVGEDFLAYITNSIEQTNTP